VAYRLDSGKLAWVTQIDGAHPSNNRGFDSLAAMGDKVVTATMAQNPQHQEAALYAWNIKTGKLEKKLDLGGRGLTGGMVRIDARRLAMSLSDEGNRGQVGVFDVEKGAFAWRTRVQHNGWNAELRVSGQHLVTNSNQYVEAFDLGEGKSLWSRYLSRQRRAVLDVAVDPSGVYILHADQQTQFGQKIERIDPDTGKTQWTCDLPKLNAAFRLAQSQDYLVVLLTEGRMRNDLANAQFRLQHFQLDKAMLSCVDKETGARSFTMDVGRIENVRYVNVYQPVAQVTVAEDGVYVDVQDSVYAFGGNR